MVSRISAKQFRWLRSWIENDETFPPERFERHVVLLHPGTWLVDDDRFPFASPNLHPTSDEMLSEAQAPAVDALLLDASGPDTACSFALYAGFLSEHDRGASRGFDEPEGIWHIGRLPYVLFSAPLAQATFSAVDDRWGEHVTFVELSYLWPNDRSWFLSSTADTCVTIIGCGNTLAQRLLAEPVLDAHEWRRE